MVTSCAAFGCTNRNTKNCKKSFHKFPLKNKPLLQKWLNAVKRKGFIPTNYHRLCCDHFIPSDYWIGGERRNLKPDAVPSVFNFPVRLQAKEKVPRREIVKQIAEGTSSATQTFNLPCSDIKESSFDCRSSAPVLKEHNYTFSGSPSKVRDKLEKVIERKQSIVDGIRTNLACKISKCNRQTKKIEELSCILKKLRDENLVNEWTASILQDNFGAVFTEMLNRSLLSSNKTSYSETLKKFALTLHFYSPVAYNYVRETFNFALPHENTLRKWYNSVDGNPGITSEALAAIKERAELSEYQIYVNIVFDETSIRKRVDWDGNKFIGFVDMGNGICGKEDVEAKEVLVVMVVGINCSWKVPIAYFLSSGIEATVKASIIKQCMVVLHECNVTVVGVTFDGLSSNVTMAAHLGAKTSITDLKPWFPHAVTGERVYVLYDACHMIKLIRNIFGDQKVLYDHMGRVIMWQYISELNNIQYEENLSLANKLKKQHIQYKNQKMVYLATQVLSSSVGSALNFLFKDLKLEKFQGAEATADFCTFFDRIFDVCNSRNQLAKGYKCALKDSNMISWEPFMEEAEMYLMGLKDSNGRFLYEGPRKTGILGFLVLLKSIKGIFMDYVHTKKLKYLATYKLSQDHLELFFSAVRNRFGWNNNPSAMQFKAAYKRLLVHNEIKSKKKANVDVLENVQLLSWCKPKVKEREDDFQELLEEIPRYVESQVSEYAENVIVYISGFVTKHLIKKINCFICCERVSRGNNNMGGRSFLFVLRKNNGGLQIPCEEVVNICIQTEKELKQLLKLNTFPKEKEIMSLKHSIISYAIRKNLFSDLHDHMLEEGFPENHVIQIVKKTVSLYIKTKLYHLTECHNSLIHKKLIRQHCTKSVTFMNQ